MLIFNLFIVQKKNVDFSSYKNSSEKFVDIQGQLVQETTAQGKF